MTDIKIRKLLHRAVLLLLPLTLLSGCIQPANREEDPLKDWKPPVCYYTTAEYSYRTTVDENVLKTGLSTEYLLLNNKTYTLGADYKPKDLVELTCPTYQKKEPIKLEKRAAKALYEMLDEMAAYGITDVMVTSAYRSYEYQQTLYTYYYEKESKEITQNAYDALGIDYIEEVYVRQGKKQLSPADVKAVVLSYSAYPGTSEHQTGLCVDLVVPDQVLTTEFDTTEAFAWLKKNAYQFGFILRYPEEKESITGYVYEPWHYRFVGREAATDIYFGKLTLEEYLCKTE